MGYLQFVSISCKVCVVCVIGIVWWSCCVDLAETADKTFWFLTYRLCKCLASCVKTDAVIVWNMHIKIVVNNSVNGTSLIPQRWRWWRLSLSARVQCFGGDCYPLAFGVPALLMAISLCRYSCVSCRMSLVKLVETVSGIVVNWWQT